MFDATKRDQDSPTKPLSVTQRIRSKRDAKIVKLYVDKFFTQVELAERFDVSQPRVCRILSLNGVTTRRSKSQHIALRKSRGSRSESVGV